MDSAPSPASILEASLPEPSRHLPRRPQPTTGNSDPCDLPIPLLQELHRLAECHTVGLTEVEFATALYAVRERCRYNQPQSSSATASQREAFFRSLHLQELALAQACALGREDAWRLFLVRYREPLAQAATVITGSVSIGRDLADSLPSELFGLSTRPGLGQEDERRSPLASYSGRGSLMGWLRATLAQRHVDRHRRTHRESPLDPKAESQLVAATPIADPTPATVTRLQQALTAILRGLDPEDAFVLSAWFLDGRTLLQIAKLLRVSEATVSRKAKRLTTKLHKLLLDRLQADGLSRRAAEEALGTDPRDLTLNLRSLLQTSAAAAFSQQARNPSAPLSSTE